MSLKPTKENIKFCQRQVARLKGMKFFSNNIPEAVTELEKALMKAPACQAQAELIIDAWLQFQLDYPQPAHIYTLARQFNDAIANSIPDACDKCRPFNGRGIGVTYKIKTGIFAGEERDGIAYCDCPRGVTLAAIDAKRKADEKRSASVEPDFQRAATSEEAAALSEIFPIDVSKEPIH